MAARGERAPERTLVAVRASAPVAAMPPKKGATMLPAPWATSSASGSCEPPVMPSATTAESSDSMAPSMAMAKAEGERAEELEGEAERLAFGPGRFQGSLGRAGAAGCRPRTGCGWSRPRSPAPAGEQRGQDPPQAQGDERSGDLARDPRPEEQHGQGEEADREVLPPHRGQRPRQRRHPLQVVLGHVGDGEAQEILELEGRDDHGDAGREPGGDGIGHELDQSPQAGDAHDHQEDAGHEGRQHQAAQSEPGGDGREQDHEAAVGPETWTIEPPRAAIKEPAMMAV